MTIEELIKQAMARMIERKLDITDVAVTSWDEEFEKAYFTGCDTCGYGGEDDTYVVEILFSSPATDTRVYRYEDKFSELIKELDT